MAAIEIDRLLRLPDVVSAYAKKRSAIYADIAAGLFPRPVQLGPHMVAWPASEIAAMIAARVRGASDDEIRAVVRDLEAARTRRAA